MDGTNKIGTIYVWIPRLVYINNEYEFLKDISILETNGYTIPSCFSYKQKVRIELALTGIWVEQSPDSNENETTTQINNMNTKENTYGLMANEVVEKISGVANGVVKKIQNGKNENKQQVQNIENTNRTMIRIINTGRTVPIVATAKTVKEGQSISANINVEYTQYGIDKIVSLDENRTLSNNSTTAQMSGLENGTYNFAIIDKVGNVKQVTVRIGDGTPELVGFKVNTTYIVTYEFDEAGNAIEHSTVPIEDILKPGYEVDNNNALINGTIDESKVSTQDGVWYNYAEQKWANIVTRNNANEAYFTWIPRYVYKLDQENQVSNVKFVTTENMDSNGNEIDLEEWTLPEAFTWTNSEGEIVQIGGYWVSKYALSPEIKFNLNANVVGGTNKIRINNITNDSNLTNTTYDIYLYKAGEDGNKVLKNDTTENIEKTKVNSGDEFRIIKNAEASNIFEELEIGDYEIRIVLNDETGKYRGENWFPVTVIDTKDNAELPDLKGFRVNTTYIVTYTDENDPNTMNASIPISEILADGYTVDEETNTLIEGKVDENKVKAVLEESGATWYNYAEQKWANIVVRNDASESYFTWIPRYIYKLDSIDQVSEVQFIKAEDNIDAELADGWQLPEAFTWTVGDKTEQLAGYWVTKYALSAETTYDITVNIVGGVNEIRVNDLKEGSSTDLKFTYKFYLYQTEGQGTKGRPKEYFAEPEKTMSKSDLAHDNYNDYECKDKTYVRYTEGLKINSTDIIYKTLNAGTYDLRIVAYDDRGYYRGEKWFNDIHVIDEGDPNEIIKQGLRESLSTGFNKDVTYYVTYDAEGNEVLTPITESMPEDWFDYNNQKWANILVENNGNKAYFVWIPRYIYKLDSIDQVSEVKFIRVGDNIEEELKDGWQLPEAFSWQLGEDRIEQIPGYWVSKYALSAEQ